jgi:hypothetical protein
LKIIKIKIFGNLIEKKIYLDLLLVLHHLLDLKHLYKELMKIIKVLIKLYYFYKIKKDPCFQQSSFSNNIQLPSNNIINSSKSFIKSQPKLSSSFNNNINTSSINNHHYVLRGSDISYDMSNNFKNKKDSNEDIIKQQPIQKSVTSIQAITQQVKKFITYI